jgi:hypothetical protein
MAEMNRQVVFKRRPNGIPVPGDFASLCARCPSRARTKCCSAAATARPLYARADPAVSRVTRRLPGSAMSSEGHVGRPGRAVAPGGLS